MTRHDAASASWCTQHVDEICANDQLNRSRETNYAGKLNEGLGAQGVRDVSFSTGNTISFSARLNGANAVGMVIEIDKT